jgi:hypothetical protein
MPWQYLIQTWNYLRAVNRLADAKFPMTEPQDPIFVYWQILETEHNNHLKAVYTTVLF